MENIREELIQPNIHCDSNKNKCYTLFFNDQEFEHIVIEKIICTLEDVKISGSYSNIKIYLGSLGGKASQLFILADYLNSYPLQITFVICNRISSCGALLPLMVVKSNIEYMPTASAMIHFVKIDIDSNTFYNYNPKICESSSDLEKVKYLNDYLYENYYSKLNLTKYELNIIKKGGDIYLNREKIEECFSIFKKKQYFDEIFSNEIFIIDEEIAILEKKIRSLKKKKDEYFIEYNNFFKKYIDK